MSSRYYLPLRHDVKAEYIYEQHSMKLVSGYKVEYPRDKLIHSEVNTDYWWNMSIKQLQKPKIINLS